MKPSCFAKSFALLLLLLGFASASSLERSSAIFYYGEEPSWSLLGTHDYIVLQPDQVESSSHGFRVYREKIYAYVSVGETEKEHFGHEKIRKEWILGKNKNWKSGILDVGSPEYRRYLFDHVIEPLRKKGFVNFFFDTLDSYQAVVKSPKARKRMEEGLVRIVEEFHQRYPDAKLILNRGFEILDRVHDKIEAVVVESLFYGLSGKKLLYRKVSREEREWTLGQLKRVREYDLPVIVIDYLPATKKAEIDRIVQKIEALGFIPYVADRHLMRYGRSSRNAIKREVLVLYDESELQGTGEDDKINTGAFRMLNLPLEYLGYIPVLRSISEWKPSKSDPSRYAGVVLWDLGRYPETHAREFEKKIEAIVAQKIPLAMLESLIPDRHTKLLKKLGMKAVKVGGDGKASVRFDPRAMGFEFDPFIPQDGTAYRASNSRSLCEVGSGAKRGSLAAITPWGGYAVGGAVTAALNGEDLWILNPFEFLRRTLRLELFPVPDTTTENGRRLLFSHVDGDGSMNRVEWDPELFSMDVVYREILKRYPIPSSISVVEGEVAPYGLYPKLSPELERIAREIYELEHVEAASHSFSHPFDWQKIVDGSIEKGYNLPIKNYKFSVSREISGSLKYINERLESAGKRTNLFFWTGECNPRENVLGYCYRNDILQINGGDTTITRDKPWLSLVAPLGVRRGPFLQVYTGAQNENVYTNDWTGPFWAYKKVIQTFELTDSPRRLKPIDIYYHFYAASKRASLNALRTVFDWAMQQETLPIFTSEYIPKVMDFDIVSIAKEGDRYLLSGLRNLHTLRIGKDLDAVLADSPGVLGSRVHGEARYLHLSPESRQILRLGTEENGNRPYLIESNGIVKRFVRKEKGWSLSLRSYFPLNLSLHLPAECTLSGDAQDGETKRVGDRVSLRFPQRKEGRIDVQCR